MTFAMSQFSYSSMDSITSFPWNPSSFSLREASVARSEPLYHSREIMAVTGWEGSTHPIQDQPLPWPAVHSRRDRREQTTSLNQTSAHGLDFNIPQNHLQSQLGAPTPCTEWLARMIPNATALRPPDRDPRVKFNMSRVPFLSHEIRGELDCHLHTKRLQHEQGLPLTPQKPHTALLPPTPQICIPGEPLLCEHETRQQWELSTDRPKCGFPAKVPKPLRSDASPQRAEEIQEPCVCPSGSLPQNAHRITESTDAILARLLPTAVVKLQDHVAQKCLEIQIKAFPKIMRESHRNAPLLRETAQPGPLCPPGEPGKHRNAAFPTLGQQPAHPIKLHLSPKHLVMQWGLLTLDPEPTAKLPYSVPARGAGVEFSEMQTDFLLDEVRENLGWHLQRKKLQQEWGFPDAVCQSLRAFLPPVPKLSSLKAKPQVQVVPILGELLFLERDVKKQLAFHTIKMQVQQRWGLPMRIQDSLRRFMSPFPEEGGRLSHPTCGAIVTPYLSPFQLRSKKAASIQLPLRAPSKRWLEDVHALPTDRRQQMARSYSWKHPGVVASKGKESPDHHSASQTGKQSTSSSCSTRPPTPVEDTTMETGRSDGAAGNQTNPDHFTLPAEVDLTTPPPGTVITEKMLAVALLIDRSELRKPLPSLSGTKGTEEKLELHMERKVISGEGSCLRPGAQALESRADLPRIQCHQVAPETPGSGQLPRSILDSLIAGQAAHDLQIKHLTEMLSSSRPLVGHVSVCQLCRKAHPGKRKGKKTQEETQVSAELHGLRDIPAPHGFNGTVNSELFRDQLPIRVCKKCRKVLQKRPAGSAGADLPRTSQRIPQRWTPGDSTASSKHNKMPVVWLLPADRSKTQDGMGKRAPTKQPKMVSIATSTTGLLQAGEKATGSPDGSPPKPPKASRARISSPSRNKVPVLKRILMCLKETFSKLQKKVKSQMSKDSHSRKPDPKFTKPPL
ncbi:protein FAM205A [Dermochelys coriacea]|uniref:protein FAM205A n=1 Tax=Dermochelys coriacea TaxID=27794 RepID=UPI001CA84E94|nr:protein FAM205A [Dermochelys coriacea]